MHARIAVGNKGVGIVEGDWVAVGGAEGQQNPRTAGDRHISDVVVGAGVAVQVLDRAGEAKELFNSHWNEIRIGADLVVLLRVSSEDVEHPTEEVGGGLISSDEKQDGDEEQLVVGQTAVGAVFDQTSQHGVGPLEVAASELLEEIAA